MKGGIEGGDADTAAGCDKGKGAKDGGKGKGAKADGKGKGAKGDGGNGKGADDGDGGKGKGADDAKGKGKGKGDEGQFPSFSLLSIDPVRYFFTHPTDNI